MLLPMYDDTPAGKANRRNQELQAEAVAQEKRRIDNQAIRQKIQDQAQGQGSGPDTSLRWKLLGSDEKSNLQDLINKYVPSNVSPQALDSLLNNGFIPDSILNHAVERGMFRPQDLAGVKNAIQKVVATIPDAKTTYTQFLKDTKNEADATDETLMDRIKAYQGLAGIRSFVGDVTQIGGENNGTSIKAFGGTSPDAPDVSADIKRITDILESRGSEVRKTDMVNKYLQDAPIEARNLRQNIYTQQRGEANRFLQDRLAPKILEDLNIRGLAENASDVGSAIAAEGANLQSQVESKIRALEAEDNQFFADAAYRIKQAQLEKSEDSLRQQIAFERESTRQKQEASFREKETDLNSEFEKQLLIREGNRSLGATQESLEVGKSNSNSTAASGLAADLGKSVSETVGTKVGTDSTTPKAAPGLPERIG